MTVPYAEVIGDPIGHSKSPQIHKFWLEKSGLDCDYRARPVPAESLPDYIADARRDPHWLGCSVTIPHKRSIVPLLTRLSAEAAAIGAVNLVRREGTELVGYNGDGRGFLEPLRPRLAESHLFRMARILGAGGAARAIAHALAERGFTLVIAARDVAQAEALLAGIRGDHYAAPMSRFASATDFPFDDRQGLLDLVVNATPLGMDGSPSLPLDWSHVPPDSIICDIVYSPLETPLLAEARARGHETIDGLHMLIGQAAVAFQLLFGHRAPRHYDVELRAMLTS
jgi:shikimate dehydrogenase